MNRVSEVALIPDAQSAALADQDVLFRKVTLHFVPLLFVCYVLNYMDRTNIGFAKLQMSDAGLTNFAYGIGASAFFVSYSAFALPANLLMTKIGARRAISGSLFGWGLTSTATMFVHGAPEFYVLRFLLGVFEAGFFPAIICYFSSWYPAHRRGAVIGIFTSATVVAGIVSGILSGGIIAYMDNLLALRGWQWMFVLEGMPAALLGVVIYFYLDENPNQAKWLSESERAALIGQLKTDPISKTTSKSLPQALADWRVYVFGLIYFLSVFGAFVLAFWQPTMIKEFGVSSIMKIGLYSAIPPLAAVIAKVYVGAHSDSKKELRWHFAVPALAGAVGFLLTPLFSQNPVLGIACLSLATAGVHGCMPMIWTVPGLYWSDTAAAAAIAVISTVGTISGAVGPAFLGTIRTLTGSFNVGMYVVGSILVVSAVLMLVVVKRSDQQRVAKA